MWTTSNMTIQAYSENGLASTAPATRTGLTLLKCTDNASQRLSPLRNRARKHCRLDEMLSGRLQIALLNVIDMSTDPKNQLAEMSAITNVKI